MQQEERDLEWNTEKENAKEWEGNTTEKETYKRIKAQETQRQNVEVRARK